MPRAKNGPQKVNILKEDDGALFVPATCWILCSVCQTPRYPGEEERTVPRVLVARPVSSLSLGVISDSSGQLSSGDRAGPSRHRVIHKEAQGTVE